ncbi:2'-5' RNA ligase (plasmid) [Sphingosinicella sp. BN140058]|nr:2'-5' RNA ligase [Sphingosinicella sp. BN140058]
MDLKYPRSYHLPQSPGLQSDDRRLPTLAPFAGRRVIVTEKMDGEGTTLTRLKTYPRSPDGRYHPSRDWMKAYHARKAIDIPELWRISGEYMFALHSLPYTRELGNALPSYFLGFGVWDQTNTLLGWDETIEAFSLLDITPVPALYDGPYHDGLVDQIANTIDPTRQEGFVLRVADPIPYPAGPGDSGRFFGSLAKWVRPRHVTTDRHWMSGPIVANELMEGVSCVP